MTAAAIICSGLMDAITLGCAMLDSGHMIIAPASRQDVDIRVNMNEI
jgi:hypothetical protein